MVRYGSEAEAFAARMGLYLKRKLKENRLTQEEFAELFDCDVKSVSRWINGGITSMVKAERIAGYFGDTVRGIVLNEDDASFRFFGGKSDVFSNFLIFLQFFRKFSQIGHFLVWFSDNGRDMMSIHPEKIDFLRKGGCTVFDPRRVVNL